MITYVYGDLFTSPARVLVNPVNTVGTMSSGIAQHVKRFYPHLFEAYAEACETDAFNLGQLLLYRTDHKWILNLPTKKHWRASAKIEPIESALQTFTGVWAEENLTSVSFPVLAEELDWESTLRPVMESYLDPLPIPIYIHLPMPEDGRTNWRNLRTWLQHPPRLLSFAEFCQLLTQQIPAMADYTLADGRRFRVTVTPKPRLSLKITPPDREALFISETLLSDIWHYIRRAGYVLPQHLPSGVDDYAPYLFTVLAQLPYFRTLQLATVNSPAVMGLHYIPPAQRITEPQGD